MKTVIFKAMISDGHAYQLTDMEGYPTANPHLFIRKLGRGHYNLSHDVSGACVLDFIPSPKVAKEWAARLAFVADFSQPLDELKKNTTLIDLCREHWRSKHNA